MLIATILLIIGFILLVYGADRLVFSCAILCRAIGVSPLIIGMTVMGIGTSLPELLIAFTASAQGQMDIVVGTAIGSNITNILLILGGAALLHPLTVQSKLLRRELPLMLLVALLSGLTLFDNTLSRTDGLCLLAMSAGWLFFTVYFAHRAERETDDRFTHQQQDEIPQGASNTVAFLWLAVACVLLSISTRMVIDNATVIANYFGISELVIALTVMSVGTSLPELATVIASALKGEDDMAIGHLIGSNIYNMVLVLGVPALIYPGDFDSAAFARDYWIMLGVSALFMLICLQRRHQPGRRTGMLLLCGFLLWVATLYGCPSVTFW